MVQEVNETQKAPESYKIYKAPLQGYETSKQWRERDCSPTRPDAFRLGQELKVYRVHGSSPILGGPLNDAVASESPVLLLPHKL